MFNIKKREKKPYQFLAWFSTLSILFGALIASLAPELYLHHFFFMFGNGLLAITAFLWKENSLLVLNSGLFLIYVLLSLIINLYNIPKKVLLKIEKRKKNKATMALNEGIIASFYGNKKEVLKNLNIAKKSLNASPLLILLPGEVFKR